MSRRLSPVTWDELIHRLRTLGYSGPYRSGKHHFMVKDSLRLTIPNPHRQDISVALLKEILDRASISREEWLGGERPF